MQTLELQINTHEWEQARSNYRCASDAPVIMGVSPFKTRTEFLTEKKLGTKKEFSSYVQEKILDSGHRIEALAMPFAEGFIGMAHGSLQPETLYPVVGVEGDYWASFDGITLAEDIVWECKTLNKDNIEQVKSGQLSPLYYWQLEHQLLVSGAEKVLYTISNGTIENTYHVWYYPVAGRREQLIAAWEQFEKDLADFVPQEIIVKPVAKTIDSVPDVVVRLTGMVTESNLDAVKEQVLAVFDGIKTELASDQDFVDAKAAIKWLSGIEDGLKEAKERALSQTESIAKVFSVIDDMMKAAKDKRLNLNKPVEAEAKNVRIRIVQQREKAFKDFIRENAVFSNGVGINFMTPDFSLAIKGKSSISSMNDACDTLLANAKIEAQSQINAINKNLDFYNETAFDFKFLFNDLGSIVTKSADDFQATVKLRIAENKAALAKAFIAAATEAHVPSEDRAADSHVSYTTMVCNISSSIRNEIIELVANHYQVDPAKALKTLIREFGGAQ